MGIREIVAKGKEFIEEAEARNAERAAAQEAAEDAARYAMFGDWANKTSIWQLRGEYQMYLYDPKPLRGTKPTVPFQMSVYSKRYRVVGATGNPYDSKKDGGVVFAYNGKPCAVCFAGKVEAAAQIGRIGTVWAVYTDYFQKGWPDLSANIELLG